MYIFKKNMLFAYTSLLITLLYTKLTEPIIFQLRTHTLHRLTRSANLILCRHILAYLSRNKGRHIVKHLTLLRQLDKVHSNTIPNIGLWQETQNVRFIDIGIMNAWDDVVRTVLWHKRELHRHLTGKVKPKLCIGLLNPSVTRCLQFLFLTRVGKNGQQQCIVLVLHCISLIDLGEYQVRRSSHGDVDLQRDRGHGPVKGTSNTIIIPRVMDMTTPTMNEVVQYILSFHSKGAILLGIGNWCICWAIVLGMVIAITHSGHVG